MSIELSDARQNVGRRVVYRPGDGTVDRGEIVRISMQYVFVLYDGDTIPKATAAHLLEWEPASDAGGGNL